VSDKPKDAIYEAAAQWWAKGARPHGQYRAWSSKATEELMEVIARVFAKHPPESYFDLCECGSVRGDHDDNLVCQKFSWTGKTVPKVGEDHE
jgi:hypothetical protein